MDEIYQRLLESAQVKLALSEDLEQRKRLALVADLWIECFQRGGKVLFCGNGGSAADAQHISAELSGRYLFNRPPLFAEALHVNSSYVTAVANDYGYEHVFSRMTEAMGRKGDILVGLSTSGNSPNIIAALSKAKELGMITVGMTGSKECKMHELCDVVLQAPSQITARIQECHITMGHILCELTEKALFSAQP